ncbi:unnamed protein product [Microthlaspi erraticum]|uniref:DIX domain-containing protein n=1 Tax=Microthlaspi erraticum TaxID=1685480 RepID=A0A6D2K118_9BRAS|nr:unnamed protein product [Microthlaspi erraticum]
MPKDNNFNLFYDLSSSSLMEVIKEEISEEDEATSLGKRKINSTVETEDERKVKRLAFFFQEPLEEEDVDMIEKDAEREDHRDNETIMEDYASEKEYVVDFDGFF